MRRINTTVPIDIILCLLASIIILILVFFPLDNTLRIIFGLPFILFIPGYILVFALFPAKKTDRGIDTLERLVLSFGLSIAVVPLIGLALNYTPWGIRLQPILFSVFFFILFIGLIGIYRWRKTDPEERFIISPVLRFQKEENTVDRTLTIILIIAIIIVIASLLYVITMPKTGETFTELYLLGPTGKAEGYPRNLTINQTATVLIGLSNSKEIHLVLETRKCLHLYHYYQQPDFGLMHVRVQSWFPFTVDVCLNGREWLARQMDAAGLHYVQRDNCFTWVEDPAKVQALLAQHGFPPTGLNGSMNCSSRPIPCTSRSLVRFINLITGAPPRPNTPPTCSWRTLPPWPGGIGLSFITG